MRSCTLSLVSGGRARLRGIHPLDCPVRPSVFQEQCLGSRNPRLADLYYLLLQPCSPNSQTQNTGPKKNSDNRKGVIPSTKAVANSNIGSHNRNGAEANNRRQVLPLKNVAYLRLPVDALVNPEFIRTDDSASQRPQVPLDKENFL